MASYMEGEGSLTYVPALTSTAGHLQSKSRTEIQTLYPCAFLFSFAFLWELLLLHLLLSCLKFNFLSGKLPPYSDAGLGKDLTCSSSILHACVFMLLTNTLQGRGKKGRQVADVYGMCTLSFSLLCYPEYWVLSRIVHYSLAYWELDLTHSENINCEWSSGYA